MQTQNSIPERRGIIEGIKINVVHPTTFFFFCVAERKALLKLLTLENLVRLVTKDIIVLATGNLGKGR